MSHEFEAAATDSIGSLFRRKTHHTLPAGTPCPNCETALEGPWCHACGQRAEDYHRSIVKLGAEVFEGFFELDGRLFRTLPKLFFKPGQLTADYLAGHRVPQIPPFRLFLIVVVIVFFAGSLGGGNQNFNVNDRPGKGARADLKNDIQNDIKKDMAKEAAQQAAKAGKGSVDINVPGVQIHADNPDTKPGQPPQNISIDENGAKINGVPQQRSKSANAMMRWFQERGDAIRDNQDAFQNSLSDWGHRLAILALPMSAAILGLMFAWRRKFYIFDHLIFSMHSLSFQGLLLSVILLGAWATKNQIWWVLILASPVHLYKHMRGVYGRGRITTLLRMFVLFVASSIGAGIIMALVFLLGMMDMGSRTASAKALQKQQAEAAAAKEAADDKASAAKEAAQDKADKDADLADADKERRADKAAMKAAIKDAVGGATGKPPPVTAPTPPKSADKK